MLINLYFPLVYFAVFAACADKHPTNLKNLTETEKKTKPTPKPDDNPLKKQIKKYLRECGADISEEDSSEAQKPNFQQNDQKSSKGTYPTSYGSYEQENRRVYRDLVETFNSSNSNLDNYRDRNSKRRGNKNNYYDDYDENDEDSCTDNRNRFNNNRNKNSHRNNGNGYDNRNNNNRNGNRNENNRYGNRNENNRNGNRNENNRNGNRNENNRNDNNRNENRFDPYWNRNEGNEDFGVYSLGGSRGYNMYGGRLMLRPNGTGNSDEIKLVKRYANDNDVQCLSQCAFGYLGLLDDSRVPSETEIIKFIQSNLQNSSKRMQAIREARRCFARLASSDNEDGCLFSKLLGKCLKLDIQDNS